MCGTKLDARHEIVVGWLRLARYHLWMSAMGIPNPAAAAAVLAAQHAATAGVKPAGAKAVEKPAGLKKRSEDELILAPSSVEGPEGLRAIAENSQEDAREDHQEHQAPSQPRKPLDLEA